MELFFVCIRERPELCKTQKPYTSMLQKKLFSIVAIVCIIFVAGATPDGDEGQPVDIGTSIRLEKSIPPKSPALVPITCTLYASLSCLNVCFLSDLGTVSIDTENNSSGEASHLICNAAAGVHCIPFSGTSGIWSITFTLSDSTQYYGEFEIY